MFRFLTGMAVGFFVMWLFGGSSEPGAQLRERAKELGRSAQRTMREATGSPGMPETGR